MFAPRILFLDDDHVLRIFRLILCNRENDAAVGNWFAPEVANVAALARAAYGLRVSEGAVVGLHSDPFNEVKDANIIFLRRGEITVQTIDQNPSLRLVQRFGERADGLDLNALRQRGIQVSCLPRRTLHFTAEHVILLMLSLGKKLIQSDAAVRRGHSGTGKIGPADEVAYNWAGIAGATGLHGRTLGIVGLGEVGSLVAGLAHALGMRVVYHNPRRKNLEQEAGLHVSYMTLPELLGQSDYVTLHAPKAEHNRKMVDRKFLGAMKSGAFFINTSRGQLVDEDALFEALSNGKLAGAGLDVHAIEPRPDNDRFAFLPNVVLTPHLAGGARSGVLDEFQVMVSNCVAVAKGEQISHHVAGARS